MHLLLDTIIHMLFIFACVPNANEDSLVLIRIMNSSEYDLEKIEFSSPASGLIFFGIIKSKRRSEYKKVNQAYPIAAISAVLNNTKIEFLPDDYLGEQYLSPGKYTYELSVIEINGLKYLRLKFVVDKK